MLNREDADEISDSLGNGVTRVATVFVGVGSPGTVSTANGGKVSAVNPTTSPGQVIAANPPRQSLIFHNPGTTNIFVYPLLNATGGVNSPSSGNLGGSFQVLPGGLITITGECQGAWGAFGASATNYLTIMESNV
jgi:hypothetical protein